MNLAILAAYVAPANLPFDITQYNEMTTFQKVCICIFVVIVALDLIMVFVAVATGDFDASASAAILFTIVGIIAAAIVYGAGMGVMAIAGDDEAPENGASNPEMVTSFKNWTQARYGIDISDYDGVKTQKALEKTENRDPSDWYVFDNSGTRYTLGKTTAGIFIKNTEDTELKDELQTVFDKDKEKVNN